jgi:hypothetical protein
MFRGDEAVVGVWRSATVSEPEPDTRVLYRTDCYIWVGYLGQDGKRYHADGKLELLPVIAWRELGLVAPERAAA